MPGIAHYKAVSAQTASPERLTVMVFQAGTAHLGKAADALRDGRFEEAHAAIDKACEIVCGLEGTLKPEAAPELCAHLQDVYRFITGRLAQAATTRDAAFVAEALRAFRPIAEAFATAAAQSPSARTAPAQTDARP